MTQQSDGKNEVVAPDEPPAIDGRHFRTVLGSFPTGVVAVTSLEAEVEPVGMIVGSFTSVSLDPPLVSFLADRSSATQARIRATGRFCANVLAADQERLCRKLATKGPDKFDGIAWEASPLGNPILTGIVSWIDCMIGDVLELGDHYLIVGRVHELHTVTDKTPLLFLRGAYGDYFSNAALVLERLMDWP
ncbi:flavin reductase family protein [Rhizobium rhizogenes]|uniref:flavin reductase family protein n=1 Tax=Rhizobium rhizogenes TaxID=359 RepID=UPI00191CBA52|nr:flavin reductase family protein [Rhizobium rhizogenes]WEO69108.1 flavin reductase family protein [Rhizobium rhizogenes]